MNPLLLPVAAAQGAQLRRRVEVLPAASGPTTGTEPWPIGSLMRLAILGESTAAGCGANTHDDAFAGSFARALAQRAGRPVNWQVIAQHGATARRVRHSLLPLLDVDVDVAVLLIGVNDVLTRRPTPDWADDLASIIDSLTQHARHVAVSGIPPFEAFPSLPRTLARYLTGRARRLDDAARTICETRSTATWIDVTDLIPADPDFFARDGFHPSSAGYQRWAEAMNERLAGGPRCAQATSTCLIQPNQSPWNTAVQ